MLLTVITFFFLVCNCTSDIIFLLSLISSLLFSGIKDNTDDFYWLPKMSKVFVLLSSIRLLSWYVGLWLQVLINFLIIAYLCIWVNICSAFCRSLCMSLCLSLHISVCQSISYINWPFTLLHFFIRFQDFSVSVVYSFYSTYSTSDSVYIPLGSFLSHLVPSDTSVLFPPPSLTPT